MSEQEPERPDVVGEDDFEGQGFSIGRGEDEPEEPGPRNEDTVDEAELD